MTFVLFRLAGGGKSVDNRPPPMSADRIKIAVVGASGYSGMELLRLLLRHPQAEIVAVTSRSLAGKSLSSEFPRFRGVGNADALKFTAPAAVHSIPR